MKKSLRELCTAIAICFCATGNLFATDNQINTDHTMDKNLNLIKEWDKVFPQSDKVSHSKVTFRNRYGITLAADMYKPKHADGKLPAIAISGPFGAVKEQSSGLYAQELAERGFLTIAFDPSYTGESGGEPRYVASPDINTEDFCAAVDFLSTRDDVDAEHGVDKHSKTLLVNHIELLLNYCMRFYERQFITRGKTNRDVLTRFENLLDEYFESTLAEQDGLPTVKYFADKLCLSSNYFGDMFKKETGKSPQEYIQEKVIELAKERISGTADTVSQIAYSLGFQYPQHFCRLFKKRVGYTPSEYRAQIGLSTNL